jgi:uncharacterized protein (TIGR02118 family)
MPLDVTVIYPNEDDTKFDLDYYLKTHMPLVKSKWASYGLKGYTVSEYQPGPDGAKPPYIVGCVLHWDNAEDLQKAMGASDCTEPIFGDIPNFCNKQPILLTGEVKAEVTA